ncbi:MAG: hypothetical protein WAV00_00330 [Nocardioides sp.]
MTTIHRPVHHHTGLYVAAAAIVLAGLLAALVAAVFWPSNASDGTPPADKGGGNRVQQYHGQTFHELCFAGRPGAPTDLKRVCTVAR